MKYDMSQVYPTEVTSDNGMQYGEDTVFQHDIASATVINKLNAIMLSEFAMIVSWMLTT